jgi:E3 ubiquitin-protein ligase RNF4
MHGIDIYTMQCLVGFAESNIFDSNIMNFHDAARRIPKRWRTSSMKSIMRLPDLNSPPAEGVGLGVPSSSMVVSHNNASSSVPPSAVGPQIGIQSAPIDVIVIDDDVMIYPTRSFPQVCLSCHFLISISRFMYLSLLLFMLLLVLK